MAKFLLSITLLLITLLSKPRKEILKAVKFSYRYAAIQIAILFAAITPYMWGAAQEVFAGQVPLLTTLVVLAYIGIFKFLATQFWSVADACAIQLDKRFGSA
ncbi:hypothetical protein [Shewanella algidipiscicola]|uniref:hypothetical protein n=1 Tax=Shewanella algidipiscicola TaxID=614070 RepID=UPI000D787DCB|nr:hypothetical protein [Shewanella algidipiscicola]